MENMAKTTEKQVIVRCFAPDMQALKATAKQLSALPDLKLGLYGQAGEVLVVMQARSVAAAAAMELTENAASRFEEALGHAAYGRGKGGMAYVTAGEMIENECVIVAADEITGNLLAEEFGATKRGSQVFDFGANSYDNAKMAAKISAASDFGEEDAPMEQIAADRAYAAAKCTRSDFGAAIVGLESERVCVAVAYKGYVYIRKMANGKDAAKSAALTVLDISRRLLLKTDVPYAKMFRAGKEVDWAAPIVKKSAAAGNGNKYIVPIIVLVALLVALGVGVWYLYNTFFIPADSESQVTGGTSQSISEMADSNTATDENASAGETQGEQTGADSTSRNSGVVHPFA